MKAIILVAGEGVRMRPLTLTKPKALVEVAGKTLLEHSVLALPEKVDELILVVGYLGNQIRDFCGSHFLGKNVSYIEQKVKEGTFRAVELCAPLLLPKEPFYVVYADDLIDKKTVEKCGQYDFSVAVKEVDRPERFGVVSLCEDGSVAEIEEKPKNPKSNLATTNVSVVASDIFNFPPPRHENGEYYLPTAIDAIAKTRKVFAVKADFWFPVGTPEDVAEAEKLFQCS